jgi:hypothetical protein
MHHCHLVIALVLSAAAPCVSAQTAVAPRNVTADDVVTKPLTDLNLKREDIPSVLLTARERPYDLTGLRGCPAIQREVRGLDAVLGDDIDVALEKTRGEKRGNAVGGVARSVVGSLIPFSGIIREVSGANANDRQWQLAMYAGASRRAFLKGYGQQKGCGYPARAATARDVMALARTRANDSASADAGKSQSGQRR